MKDLQSLDLSILISRALEGDLLEAEYRLLNEQLEDPEARMQYFETLKVNLALREVGGFELDVEDRCDMVLDPQLWIQLARAERSAPAVELPVETPKRPRIEKVRYDQTVHRINKTSLITAILSMAALLFMLIYIQVQTHREIETATVIDTYKAQWADGGLMPGSRVTLSRDPLVLLGGVVKLETDEGVGVVIEGPAQFRFSGVSAVELEYGRLYARVQPSGIGFSVSTPVSRVIDLGTAFGVRADIEGSTQLHVFEGKTSLSLKDQPSGSAQIITEGQARQISGVDLSIREISLEQKAFIENFNPKQGWIFRGQKQLNLADMVGGGNGLGTGKPNTGIDPVMGASCGVLEQNRWVGNGFVPVPHAPFIDGVFVPNGKTPQVVSSRGDLFYECPLTAGNFYTEVIDTPMQIDRTSVRLVDAEYKAGNGNRCIFLHANLGITFDLDKIRDALAASGMRFSRFRSRAGISDAAWRDCNADIWVLIDGQVRYCRKNIRMKGSAEWIDIALSGQDRFLTLVATDGGDPVPAADAPPDAPLGIDSDWCVFDEPVLVLE